MHYRRCKIIIIFRKALALKYRKFENIVVEVSSVAATSYGCQACCPPTFSRLWVGATKNLALAECFKIQYYLLLTVM